MGASAHDMSARRGVVLLLVVAAVFAVMMLAGALGVFWWWGVGFDEAETYGMATPSTDRKMVSSFWVGVVGVAGLVATSLALALRISLRR